MFGPSVVTLEQMARAAAEESGHPLEEVSLQEFVARAIARSPPAAIAPLSGYFAGRMFPMGEEPGSDGRSKVTVVGEIDLRRALAWIAANDMKQTRP